MAENSEIRDLFTWRTPRTEPKQAIPARDQERAQAIVVPLTKGKVALVSPEDAERVLRHKWCATVTRRGKWYAKRKLVIDKKHTSQMLHRFILSAPPAMDVDHRNGDGLDCTRGNMRVATRQENRRNSCGTSHSSAFKGVSWDAPKRRWRANIVRHGGKRSEHIGYFTSEIQAARAYDAAAKEHFGEFARLNFP